MTILINDYTDFIQYCNDDITEYQSNDISYVKFNAFSGNSVIKSLSFPKVTTVSGSAFFGMSNLEQISLPKVTSLGQFSLSACEKLTQITLPSIVTLGSYVFNASENLISVSAPNCTSVQWNCFQNCTSLSQLDFLENLTYVDQYSFNGCKGLTSLPLQNLSTLRSCAFKDCSNVTKIWLPNSCNTIEAKTYQNIEDVTWAPFYGCNSNCIIYTSAHSPYEGWSQYWNYYDDTHKLDVCWGSSYQDYLDDVYRQKSTLENFVEGRIREIIYPDNITLLDNQFYGCDFLFNIQIPSTTILPNGALWDCTNLKGEIPQLFPNVTKIGNATFTGCMSLTSADLSNVTEVGDSAFQNCVNIKKVWIPSTCTTIGSPLFPNCYEVTFYTDASADLPGWEENWNSLDWGNTKFGTVVYNATYEQYLQA